MLPCYGESRKESFSRFRTVGTEWQTASRRWPFARVVASKHLFHHLSRLDDVQRSADVALVFVARVDAEGLADGAEQVLHRDGPVGDLDAEPVGGADDLTALDAGACQTGVEGRRVV